MNKKAIGSFIVRSRQQLFSYLRDYGKRGDEVIYRGQKNSRWKVESSYYRFCRQRSIEVDARVELYRVLLKGFFDECMRLRVSEFDPREQQAARTTNYLEAWAQHYGVPTRFVDWSRSPYVAAFFAFGGDESADDRLSGNCSIFVLNERKVLLGIRRSCRLSSHAAARALLKYSDSTTPYTTRYALYDGGINRRIGAQVGALYSVPFGHSCFEQYVMKEGFPDETLLKIIIPYKMRREVLINLRDMGISGGALYLDAGHVAVDVLNAI